MIDRYEHIKGLNHVSVCLSRIRNLAEAGGRLGEEDETPAYVLGGLHESIEDIADDLQVYLDKMSIREIKMKQGE